MLSAPNQQVHLPSRQAVLADLKEKVGSLEGTPRRFARTIPISDFIDDALPARGLPLGCVHEIKGNPAAVIAFSGLLSARIARTGTVLYVAPDRHFYPLGLLPYGVNLQHWIHICAHRQQDLVWTVLEALRCPQVNAVLAVMQQADLTLCRRLQLAAESSGATAFLLGNTAPVSVSLASAITRWRIAPLKGVSGQAFDQAAWRLKLLYCRGSRPDMWDVVYRNGRLESLIAASEIAARPVQRQALASEKVLAG